MTINSVTSGYSSIQSTFSQTTTLSKEESAYDANGDGVLSASEKATMELEQSKKAQASSELYSNMKMQGPPPNMENMSNMQDPEMQSHIDMFV